MIDHMPIDSVEAYIDAITPDVMTFADEAALARYLQQHK